jgi:hypothetical protein
MEELKFNRDADLSYSRYTVDPDVAEMYAKSNCKHCHGLGIIRTQTGMHTTTIRYDRPVVEHMNYCVCTRKNAKKYG